MSPLSTVAKIVQDVKLAAWDLYLTGLNLFQAKRKVGAVTPQDHPGSGGKWPEYVAPKEGDSRCSCPALNAMANHGILPHDGKNITFKELNEKINITYNFAPTFCFFVPDFAARMLGKNYETDTFDLKDLDLHSEASIEHDGSLVRRDRYFEPDQSKIHMPFVRELIDAATGKDANGDSRMTIEDLARMLSKRYAEARAENPEFMLNKSHATFGSSNASTLLTIFGGRVKDIEVLLTEERLPDGWESRILEPHGLTILTFNKTVFQVSHHIDESKFPQPVNAKATETPAPEGSAAAAST